MSHAGHRWGGKRLRRARLLRIRKNRGRRAWALWVREQRRARVAFAAEAVAEALSIGRPDLAATWMKELL